MFSGGRLSIEAANVRPDSHVITVIAPSQGLSRQNPSQSADAEKFSKKRKVGP